MNRIQITIWTTMSFIVVLSLSSVSFTMPGPQRQNDFKFCTKCGIEIAGETDLFCTQCYAPFPVENRPATERDNWVEEYPQHQEANQYPNQNSHPHAQRAVSSTSNDDSVMPRWSIGLLIGTVIAELAVSTTSAAFYFVGNNQLKDANSAMVEANKSCKKEAVKNLAREVPSTHAFSSNTIVTVPGVDLIFGAIFALFALPASDTPLWPSLITVLRTGIAATALSAVVIQKSNIEDFSTQLDKVSSEQNCDLSKAKEKVSDASTNLSNSIISSAVRLGMSVLEVILIVARYTHQSRVLPASV